MEEKEKVMEELREIDEIEKERAKRIENDLLITCEACGHEISRNAEVCPNCGEPAPKTKERKFKEEKEKKNNTIAAIILVIVFVIIIALNGGVIPLFTFKITGTGNATTTTTTSSSSYK